MQKALSLVAFAVLAACADHGGAASTDSGVDAGADGGSAVDAGIDAVSGMPATLVIGASAGTVTDAFGLTASGTAAAPYGEISFSNDVGMLDVGGGAAAGFVYATVAEAGYTLYDGFAVTPTAWDAFYLYCSNDALTDVYDEKIGGHGMAYAAVTGGTCSATSAQTVAHVALPAFSIPTPAPIGGYTVHGHAVDIAADGTGTLQVGAQRLPLVVFDDVDCTACGGSGWFELHSIVWDAAAQRVVFVIVYLVNGTATSVELAYARSLPDLGDPLGTVVLGATWTAPHALIKPRAAHGTPPPSFRP
jgi:hypothetical protein